MLLLVLLAFWMLCLPLLRSLFLPRWLMLYLCSLFLSGSGGSGSLFFFSSSFCSSASLPFSFAGLSSTVFFFSSSGSSASSLSLSSWRVVLEGSDVAPGFGAVLVSLPVSVPSLSHPFAADPAPSVSVPAAPLPSALSSAPSAPMI